ncbi:MAG TPA: class I SAM-dependent methyltransferase [Bryobacteraceae bacterium]|nr:class I SAM-dependent methyltransferase [Bryobacteraceae bacterium]
MDRTLRLQFLDDYRKIRHAEGRGSDEPAYYLALPYKDLSGRNSSQWDIRGRSYRHFERKILRAWEQESKGPLQILDLGAGNGWMSHRLRGHGHMPVALDIFTDPRDGLLAARRYSPDLPLIESDFNMLPFAGASFDVIIYNASIHYSPDYRRTLAEARRCLRPGGRFVIIDSPIYKAREHGERMREEKHQQFKQQYGFRSDAVPSIEFLDEPAIAELGRDLGIEWQVHRPWHGWNWFLRPWKARLKRRRPPSQFHILVGTFK